MQIAHTSLKLQVPFSAYKRSDSALHDYTAPLQLVRPQLLQIRDLSCPEKDLCLAELIQIGAFKMFVQYLRASLLNAIPVDIFKLTQHPVSVEEIGVCPSAGKAGCWDANCLEHAAGSQLLHCPLWIVLEGFLGIVRLDAPDIHKNSCWQYPHWVGSFWWDARSDNCWEKRKFPDASKAACLTLPAVKTHRDFI